MPAFTFVARDSGGRTQTGSLAAESREALVTEIRGRGWLLLDVKKGARPGASAASLVARLDPRRHVPPSKLDVEFGLQQIASMLRSGLTLLTALKTAAEQARRPSMKRVWMAVHDRIEEGSSFADALREHPRRFSPIVVQLVRVGEQSGTLEVVLLRGAEQLERHRNLRATLLSALLYPAIVLAMALGVTAFMVTGVIPKLERFLASRGRRLPDMTQALLDVSHFSQRFLPLIVFAILGSILGAALLYRWPPGRLAMDRFALRVPIFGKLLRLSGTASLARGLSLLLENGITLLDALSSSQSLLGNRALAERVAACRRAVLAGGSLAGPLAEGKTFLPMLPRMVAVGEMTGTLDPVLAEVARFHEAQLATAVRRFSILVEPAVILVVGAIVGFVYMSFFVALFSIASGGR